jgi:hypothetical protein
MHVKVDPVKIDATVTVLIRVERELENFYDELDSRSSMTEMGAANAAPRVDEPQTEDAAQ